MIETSIYYSKDLTIHTVTGKLTAEELIQTIREYYSSGKTTMRILWNCLEADAPFLSSEDVKNVAIVVRKLSGIRKGGKTAIVVSRDFWFGLERMYKILAGIDKMPAEYFISCSLEDCCRWLSIEV